MNDTKPYSDVPTISPNESAFKPLPAPAREPAQVEVDDSDVSSDYANFCRLSGMPEELLIDFGINPQPMGAPTQPIVVTQRVVTGWYTAKRLLQVLQLTIDRHEAAFGVLETDVQKRVRRT